MSGLWAGGLRLALLECGTSHAESVIKSPKRPEDTWEGAELCLAPDRLACPESTWTGGGVCGGGRAGGPRGPGCPVMPVPHPQVAEILGAILVHLPMVDHREVRHLLIEGILLLAHYHQETVLTALLRQPLPMERWVPECGAMASRDPQTGPTRHHRHVPGAPGLERSLV